MAINKEEVEACENKIDTIKTQVNKHKAEIVKLKIEINRGKTIEATIQQTMYLYHYVDKAML